VINIINRKIIDPRNRIDAEFYKVENMRFEEELKKSGAMLLSGLCEESDKKVNPSEKEDEYFRYIEITDVNLLDGSFLPQTVLGIDAPSRARKICRKNEIIISTVRPNRNAVAIVSSDEEDELVCSTGFCVLKCKEGVQPEEIFIFLKSSGTILQLNRRIRATMYPAVANIDIMEIRIPEISEDLRNRITRQMAEVYVLRKETFSKLRKIYEIVEEFCDSILRGLNLDDFDRKNNKKLILKSEVFNIANRMDPQFYRLLHDEIEKRLEKYEKIETLGTFFYKPYTGKTPAKGDYCDSEEDSVPIIKVGTLTNSGIKWSGVEYASLQFFNKNKKAIVKNGDIVFTSSAHSEDHIGKKVDVISDIPETYEGKCLFVGELMLLRNKDGRKIDPYYLVSFLRSTLGKIQIQRCARGISSHIYGSDIEKYVKIPIPDDEIIEKISRLVSEVELRKNKAISIVRNLIKEYEAETQLTVFMERSKYGNMVS